VVSEDGKYIHIFPKQGSSAWFYARLDENPINSSIEFIPINDQTNGIYNYITNDDDFVYLITNVNAPNYRLVKVDLNQPQEVSLCSKLE